MISTFPETRSGWLRAHLIERVQETTSKPVHHVVVEEAGGDGLMEAASIAADAPRARGAPRPARRRTSPRGSRPRCSGCCFSSSPRSCSSERSSRPTSSSGSWATPTGRRRASELPKVIAGRQHRDPDLVELHDALGARGRAQREPRRAAGRPAHHLPARPDLPHGPGQRVRAHRLRAAATTRRARSSTGSPACTAPTCSSA